mgnify:CR=1 FL=1
MSIRNFDFFEVFMKKIWISLISAFYCGFTVGYMHFADPRTNAGALSTIGAVCPVGCGHLRGALPFALYHV